MLEEVNLKNKGTTNGYHCTKFQDHLCLLIRYLHYKNIANGTHYKNTPSQQAIMKERMLMVEFTCDQTCG